MRSPDVEATGTGARDHPRCLRLCCSREQLLVRSPTTSPNSHLISPPVCQFFRKSPQDYKQFVQQPCLQARHRAAATARERVPQHRSPPTLDRPRAVAITIHAPSRDHQLRPPDATAATGVIVAAGAGEGIEMRAESQATSHQSRAQRYPHIAPDTSQLT